MAEISDLQSNSYSGKHGPRRVCAGTELGNFKMYYNIF